MAVEELNALEHYGTKGMHWGQRLYQNPDGSYTELGKERRRVGYKKAPEVEESEKIGGKAYKDMTWSERRKARKRARHNEAERKAQRHFNKDKRRAIEDGDLSFISKNISRFSNDEIDEATNRFRKMKSLLDLEKENREDPEKFVDKALKWLDKASKASKSISDISKSFSDAKKSSEQAKQEVLRTKEMMNPKEKKDQNYWNSKNAEYDYEQKKKNDKEKERKDKKKEEQDDEDRRRKLNKEDKEERKAQEKELKNEREEAEKKAKAAKKEAEDAEKALKKAQQDEEDRLRKVRKEEAEAKKAEYEAELKRQEYESKINKAQNTSDPDKAEKLYREAQRAREEAEDAESRATRARGLFNDDYWAAEEARKAVERAQNLSDTLRITADESYNRKQAADAAYEQMKNRNYYDSFMDDYYSPTTRSNSTSIVPVYESYSQIPDQLYGSNKEKYGSFFKKFKKENSYDSKDYKQSYKDLDDYTDNLFKRNQKAQDQYWNEYNNYNNNNKYGSSKKNSSSEEKSYTEKMRDKRWSKELKKNSGDSRLIDKWVKEMAEKYQKEHGLSRQDAIDKAEDYVDYWIDLYDEKSKK